MALHSRKGRAVERTAALLLAAAICYVPANILPVLVTTTLVGTEADTILGGVALLLWSVRMVRTDPTGKRA